MMTDYPGFALENLVLMKEEGRLVGAMIYYNPSPIVNTRVERFDWTTRVVGTVVRSIHNRTGRLLDLPREGERLRTLHLQAFCYESGAARPLFSYLNNLAREVKAHTIAFMVDAREPVRMANWVCFRYKSHLYGAFKKGSERLSQELSPAPLYFNITNA